MGILNALPGIHSANSIAISAETRAPTLGANAVSSWPPSGWTSLFSSGSQSTSVLITLPFNFYADSLLTNRVYLSSKMYLNFANAPTNPTTITTSTDDTKIAMYAATGRYLFRVANLIDPNNRFIRVRVEASSFTGPSVQNADIIYEVNFYNNGLRKNFDTVEFLVGKQGSNSGILGFYSGGGTNLGSANFDFLANTSYVYQSTSIFGSSWVCTKNAHVSPRLF